MIVVGAMRGRWAVPLNAVTRAGDEGADTRCDSPGMPAHESSTSTRAVRRGAVRHTSSTEWSRRIIRTPASPECCAAADTIRGCVRRTSESRERSDLGARRNGARSTVVTRRLNLSQTRSPTTGRGRSAPRGAIASAIVRQRSAFGATTDTAAETTASWPSRLVSARSFRCVAGTPSTDRTLGGWCRAMMHWTWCITAVATPRSDAMRSGGALACTLV